MALERVTSSINLACVPVILEQDDALDLDHPECNYKQYQTTGDEKHLRYLADKEPTKFICNFQFNAKESAIAKNSMMGTKDDEGNPSIALGSWQFKVARIALKDIQNPSYLPEDQSFKMVKYEGYVDEKLLNELSSYGVVDAIFTMYSNLVLNNAVRKNAKNS